MDTGQDIRKRRRTPGLPASLRKPSELYDTTRNFAYNLGSEYTGARLDPRLDSAGGAICNPCVTWEQDMLNEFEPYLSWDGKENAPNPEGRGIEVVSIIGDVNVRTRSGPTMSGGWVPNPGSGAQSGWLLSIHGIPPEVDSEGRNNFSDRAMLYLQGDVGEVIPSQAIVFPPGIQGLSEDGIIRVKAAAYMNEDSRMALHFEVSMKVSWRYAA